MGFCLDIIKKNLVTAIEPKSQVGSFGDNFNNRTEEALGSAVDLWTAYKWEVYDRQMPPWVGYLVLMEKEDGSTTPVGIHEPYFKVREEFKNTSYLERYDLFCSKLMMERHYSSACLIWFETKKILDPAVGEGAFILCLLGRMVNEFKSDKDKLVSALKNITVVELGKMRCDKFLKNVEDVLFSVDPELSNYGKYINLINSNYLIADTSTYDVIVGNPPYVRYDNIPIDQLEIYKRLFPCFKNRSDLYIAFIEKGIKSLNKEGVLTFICADRWLNNQYGRMLKKTIYNNFYFSDIVRINGFSPFDEEVIAYPSIFSIRNARRGKTRYFSPSKIDDLKLDIHVQKSRMIDFDYDGNAILTKDNVNLLSLESQGFKIGIGVATGADDIFIVEKANVNIEKELLVPLITRRDVVDGKIEWTDRHVINPFVGDTTTLIDLDSYPQLKEYFTKYKGILMQRHISKKNSNNWFKTIDRIVPSLTKEPKLLIPDISTKNIILFGEGRFYPHHNFYHITGNGVENLLALRAILSTDFVRRQIAEKGLLMNGGALRWQAQTLRKIRIPNINSMSEEEKKLIISAYDSKNAKELENAIRLSAA